MERVDRADRNSRAKKKQTCSAGWFFFPSNFQLPTSNYQPPRLFGRSVLAFGSWRLGVGDWELPLRPPSLVERGACGQAAERDDPDEIRENLQRVHQVAPGPDEIDLRDGPEGDQEAVDPAIRHHHARAQPVGEELLPVKGPA